MKAKSLTKNLFVWGLLIILLLSPFLVQHQVYANGDEDDDEVSTGDGDHDGDNGDDEDTGDSDHDEDNDQIDDEEEEKNEREIEIEHSDNEVQVESRYENQGNENEFKLKVTTEDEGVKFKLEFSNEINDTETELEFKVKFTEIVEYIDTTNDGIYNESLDEVVQVYQLSDFLPIEYTTENQSGMIVHILHIETTDGVFASTMYVIGEFGLINGTIVAPNEVKIDVIINGFPYNSTESDLALKVKLESELEVEVEENENSEDEENGIATDEEKEIEISTGDYSGFFAWAEYATVDGIQKPVYSSPVDPEDNGEKFYLNYPRGQLIVHDPKIGVSGILSLGNGPSLIPGFTVLTALMSISLFSVIVLLLRKRK